MIKRYNIHVSKLVNGYKSNSIIVYSRNMNDALQKANILGRVYEFSYVSYLGDEV